MRTARVSLPGMAGTVEAEVLDGGARLRAGGYASPVADARFAPASDGLVYGVVLNDRVSLDALGAVLEQAPYSAPPKAPVLYIKPWNTHACHGATVQLPRGAHEVEVFGALGIVIGAPATRVTQAQALQHVRGYTIVADLSLPQRNLYRPPIREKCFDGSCPIGPWVVSRDEVAEAAALEVEVDIDGRTMQRTSLHDLVRPIPQLIADVTAFMTLYPGDVLLAGIPHAGARARPGQRIEVRIAGIGTLEARIAKASV